MKKLCGWNSLGSGYRRNSRRDFFQVIDELPHLIMTRLVVARAENRRRMHGRGKQRRQGRFDKFAAMLRDAKFCAEQRLRRRRTKAYDDAGLDYFDLFV